MCNKITFKLFKDANARSKYLLLAFLAFQVFGYSQKMYDNTWVFDTYYPHRIIVSFTDGMQIDSLNGRYTTDFYQTSISDEAGKLAFYSNGCNVYNRNNQIMDGGNNLNPGELWRRCLNDGAYGGAGRQIITVPDPQDKNIYHLFHEQNVVLYEPSLNIYPGQLLHTIIDMSQNNGYGKVISKNKSIIKDTLLYGDEMVAIRNTNNKDWWIITQHKLKESYFRILLRTDTIMISEIQMPGCNKIYETNGSGGAVFTPDGKKLVRYNRINGWWIFDFDRTTGLLSNLKTYPSVDTTLIIAQIEVSPNSRFVYFTGFTKLYQFDLESQDFSASQVLIDTFDGFKSPFDANFHSITRGPDCRIYTNSTSSVDHLGVIMYPDKQGKACDFRQHFIKLPSSQRSGLPHYPNYRLGHGPVCDSTIPFLTKLAETHISESPIMLWPNPATGNKIYISTGDKQAIQIILTDMQGIPRIKKEYPNWVPSEIELDIQHIPSGMYVFSIRFKDGTTSSGRMIKL